MKVYNMQNKKNVREYLFVSKNNPEIFLITFIFEFGSSEVVLNTNVFQVI